MGLVRTGRFAYESESPEETERFGEVVSAHLRDGDVLILTGGLGAGKTCFTKGVSRGLGDGHPVTSPTFALMAVHDGGRLPLFHFDLYRLEHAYELEDTGIYDVLGYEGACLLEWGEQFQDELTDEYLGVLIGRAASGQDEAGDATACDEGALLGNAGAGAGGSDLAGLAAAPRVIRLEPHGSRAEALAAAIDADMIALSEEPAAS